MAAFSVMLIFYIFYVLFVGKVSSDSKALQKCVHVFDQMPGHRYFYKIVTL